MKVEEFIKHIKSGWWVACNSHGMWTLFEEKPEINEQYGIWHSQKGKVTQIPEEEYLIDPVDNWRESLIQSQSWFMNPSLIFNCGPINNNSNNVTHNHTENTYLLEK